MCIRDRIITARPDNDASSLNYFLSGANRTGNVQGDSSGQLAKLAGVAPGTYSASELALIIEANKDNKPKDRAYILSGTNRTASAEASVVTPGEVQLAAVLGVDPAHYTLAQLIRMTADLTD